MILCNKIREVPPLLNESQQTVWCPDCEECNCGTCSHLTCTDGDVLRPFDGSSLLQRKVAMDSNNEQSLRPSDSAAIPQRNGRLQSAECEEMIKHRIAQRTGGRVQWLEVEVTATQVVIRGCAPSYYVKQLALRGALEALGSAAESRIELNVEVSDSA
jgi:hypothetical protein